MDAFEYIVATILQEEGNWIRTNFKIRLEKAEKAALGKPSLPRPDIDILAYRPGEGTVSWVECKSLLDSPGLKFSEFKLSGIDSTARFAVFGNRLYRKIVSRRLILQLEADGLLRGHPRIQYCLAAGHIASDADRRKFHSYFARRGWLLLDEDWIRSRLWRLSGAAYQNEIVTMTAKLVRGERLRR